MLMQNRLATVLLVILLTSCQGSDSGLPDTQPPTKYFGLVLNQGDDTISSYQIDVDTNTWMPTGPDINTLSGPNTLRLSKDKTLAFVLTTNSGSPSITTYKVDRNTGTLTQAYRRGTGSTPMDVAISPDKRFVYVANNTPSSIYIYERDPITNVLTELSVLGIAANAQQLEITRDGRFLYVGRADLATPGGGISAYLINSTTGMLTGGFSTTVVGLSTTSVAASPTTNKFCQLDTNLKSGFAGDHRLTCRDITATGSTTGGEFSITINYPYHIKFDRTGKFIFVVHKVSNKVTAFTRNEFGVLVPDKVNQQNTQTSPSWVSIDPKRNFIYVANTGSDSVSVYILNPNNGAIGFLQNVSVGSQPIVVEVVASN